MVTIHERQQYTADKSEIIDINLDDPISQLVLTYEPTNGNQAYGDGHPARCISKIELIDGADVLFSLSGQECQAADFYHSKNVTPSIILFTNGMNSEQIYNINFGRYLYDEMLALNPNKHTNLQLKVTMDINGGGSLVAGGYLTIMGHVFDEKKISPKGFLMHKEIKSYVLSSASHEYTDLPVDYPYRKLFVRAQRYGTGPEYQIDTIKLSENVDKKIVLNHSMFQILRAIASQTPPYREWIIGPGTTTANYFYCTPTYWPAFAGSLWRSVTTPSGLCFYEGDGGRFKEVQEGAGVNWQCHVQGWAPHGVVEIPFGKQDSVDDFYDVRKVAKLKLDVKGGSSVGTSQTSEIFLQQFRSY